ncbi:Crp/Fnr family transcriptional regulator [Caenimonas aquaedulcis]|uniref:Crp/Fnr family transcriptional regulator n=1 Tax=Caenimonas aquaedulcis TaxID=2793270 RepID=A0A931H7N6_9BURK|nr:Crp/Fnr family transcriptional regulator [Caenimonas aquaedulcis]MBG9390201.1 Crp/Fnr family transcriptional regulator [Caenimonas aquaedulcis]
MTPLTPCADDRAANLLLAAFPRSDAERWRGQIDPVDLRVGERLHEMGQVPRWAYFPVDAIVSLLVPTHDGRCDEVCAVGREGMVGIALFMDNGASTSRAVVQAAGRAFRVRPAWVQEEFASSPAVTRLFLRYAMARVAELAQSVMCGRHHTTEQRLARRLLHGMDCRPDGHLWTTQEQLAGLLGVRRESVTSEALKLQRAGAIAYSRGHITVLDRAQLVEHSCECYDLVRGFYRRVTGSQAPASARRAVDAYPSHALVQCANMAGRLAA